LPPNRHTDGPIARTVREGARRTVRKTEAEPLGMCADGHGFYLHVSPAGRSFICRYALNGKRRDMGIGRPGVIASSGRVEQRHRPGPQSRGATPEPAAAGNVARAYPFPNAVSPLRQGTRT